MFLERRLTHLDDLKVSRNVNKLNEYLHVRKMKCLGLGLD